MSTSIGYEYLSSTRICVCQPLCSALRWQFPPSPRGARCQAPDASSQFPGFRSQRLVRPSPRRVPQSVLLEPPHSLLPETLLHHPHHVMHAFPASRRCSAGTVTVLARLGRLVLEREQVVELCDLVGLRSKFGSQRTRPTENSRTTKRGVGRRSDEKAWATRRSDEAGEEIFVRAPTQPTLSSSKSITSRRSSPGHAASPPPKPDRGPCTDPPARRRSCKPWRQRGSDLTRYQDSPFPCVSRRFVLCDRISRKGTLGIGIGIDIEFMIRHATRVTHAL